MRTIRGIVWLCLATLLCASHCYAQDVQYYWVKPDKVFLWKSLEDTKPVLAIFEPTTLNWTITPNTETEQWQKSFEEIAYKYYPTLNLDAYKKENKLLPLMLTKLHNDYPSIRWANLREPIAEMFWQPAGPNVQLAFLTRAPSASDGLKTFTRQDDRWTKKGAIDLKSLNLDDKAPSLRTVFNLPSDPAADNDWISAWNDFANASFQGDAIRPIMYQDQDNKVQWIWWEKKESNDPLPPRYVVLVKPSPVKEPALTFVQTKPPPEGMTLWETVRFLGLVLLLSVLVALTVTAFVKRAKLWEFISNMIGDSGVQQPSSLAPSDNVIISAEGLVNLLHNLALARVQSLPQKTQYKIATLAAAAEPDNEFGEAASNHLAEELNWTHKEYLRIINSAQFQEKVTALDNEIRAAHYRELGLELSEAGRVKEWIALGRAFETTVVAPEVSSSSFVKTTIKQQHPGGLKSAADWMEYWPRLLTTLGDLSETQQRELGEARRQIETMAQERLSEKNRIEREMKGQWEGKVQESANELRKLNDTYVAAFRDLEKARQSNSDLQSELDQIRTSIKETEKRRQVAQSGLTKFTEVFSDIQEVEKLSRVLRMWIQGYFVKQHTSTGEMRSVGLLAALVNYSLYQLCFSILEERQPMRKAMAKNLYTFSQIFNRNANYPTVYESLKRIEPKVEAVFDEPTNPAPTIDDPLFQACLRSLQTDGINLSPFFIDEKENMINVVNAS